MTEFYSLGNKLVTENDLPFDRNLVLGTSQTNTVNCDGGIGNAGLFYDVSSDFISAEKNQVFSASVKVTADSDGGTFYFGITNPWQTIIYHNVEKGTHIYTWNNLTWTRNFNSQQEFTVDNHKGQVKFENLIIVKGNKTPKWSPASEDYAMKADIAKDVEKIDPEIKKNVDNNFDLNEIFSGFVASNGKAPKNSPQDINPYYYCYQLGLGENRVEFLIDVELNMFTRARSGVSGVMAWNNWKRIGGVTSPAICLIHKALSRFSGLEVA